MPRRQLLPFLEEAAEQEGLQEASAPFLLVATSVPKAVSKRLPRAPARGSGRAWLPVRNFDTKERFQSGGEERKVFLKVPGNRRPSLATRTRL